MSFLKLEGRNILVTGLANRKSVAWHIGQVLSEAGARVIYSVRSEERKASLGKWFDGNEVFVCDVEDEKQIARLAGDVSKRHAQLHGLVHSIAFANYEGGLKPFHETRREDFLQATQISCFSLVELARAFKPHLSGDAAVLAIGISSTHITPENYGYMSPIKASLEATARYLAKSFSADTDIRFNTLGAGPLKTSASAGIPGYMENYLYAEKLTLRHKALLTREVADTAAFLLSPRSSGINGQHLVVDAGLGLNTFDAEVVRLAMRPEKK